MSLPLGGHSWPAAEDIQHPGPGLEEAGAGTGRWEEQVPGGHPACALVETEVRHQDHLGWQVVVAKPEIRVAKWTAVAVVEDLGRIPLMEGLRVLGSGKPCENHSC